MENIKISDRYIETIGRRKTASARTRMYTKGDKKIIVNKKEYKEYFPTLDLQKTVLSSLDKMNLLDKFKIEVRVKGGGIFAQAEAIRHGIARALVEINPNFRKRLKKVGYLTRDSRMRERKKFGLKRARRAPQWRKR
ncbi:MAG: 30S ribosomal protein S9 [Patescibacteria group bacterium]|nr:30S ribosomal protein S9 [Patescibacteria group bacterium]